MLWLCIQISIYNKNINKIILHPLENVQFFICNRPYKILLQYHKSIPAASFKIGK